MSRTLGLIVARAKRNCKARHARCVAHSAARGRRHPKPREAALSAKRPPTPIEDERLQLAFRVLHRESTPPAAAEAARG